MSEKILGFREEDVYHHVKWFKKNEYINRYETENGVEPIPVVLKSVYYNALKNKNKRIKKLLQIIKTKEAVRLHAKVKKK